MKCNRAILVFVLILASVPAMAEPVAWTDPETGCQYLLNGDGITPKLKRNGLPDCPDARREQEPSFSVSRQPVTQADIKEVVRTIEGVGRKMDELRREVERSARK